MYRYSILVAITLMGVFGSGISAFAQEVLAVYGEAVEARGVCPPNWQFLWNADEAVGRTGAYAPIPYNEQFKMFCFTNDVGKMDAMRPRSNMTGPAASQDSGKIARYWIATYTITNDSSDVVWLRNGNVSHRYGGDGNGIALKVFVNDAEELTLQVPRQRRPTLFQHKLGKLKRGDVVGVMVGPGEAAGGFFNLYFMLERWPAATDVLPEAINIISPEITAVTPHRDPRGGLRTGYINQHQRFVEYARKEKPELVFLGDSITAGWPRELLTTHFAKYKPANNGISGDWVQGLRWRVAHGVYDEIQPRVIVVLIGVNNLSNGFLPEEVALGTQLLVNDIRAKTPKTRILLLGIFPRGRTFIPPAGDDIRKVNALTAQLADQQYVFFMDLADQLIEPDGSISAEVFPDGLHPGRPGYQRWADAIAPTLAKLFEMTL